MASNSGPQKFDFKNFSYERAFSRTLGWVSDQELQTLSRARVAIAGMGGVGGSHLMALVRLGITKFHIADFDLFEIENFNRQFGASISHVGEKKAAVMKELALDINPKVDIQIFPDGVTSSNINEFLQNVDVFLDGLDLFAIDLRQQIFSECYKQGIPAITVGPIATGASLMTFLPNKMSFDDYFNFKNLSLEAKVMTFVVGLTPSLMQARYLTEKKYFDLAQRKAPSTIMGCMVASGVAATEVMKILLDRGSVRSAPWSLHYDPYLQKYKMKYLWLGHRNPWHRLKLFFATRIYGAPKDILDKEA